MRRRMTVEQMMKSLKSETINTWFDLGLFIDRFKEEGPVPSAEFKESFDDFKSSIGEGGIGFVTFYYSIDGVTLEVEKYVKIFKNNMNNVDVHYIAGKFYPEASEILDPKDGRLEIPEIRGFDDWALYKDFFFTKLERGSKEYNALIIKYWKEVLTIVEKMGAYIEQNNIKMLYLINTNSNPGNVSLALANVLVSEFLGIPVINNNHDFYWEGGNKKVDIEQQGLEPGPRDFFFINSDVGEFFSQIEVLYPWESRSWINVNINRKQSKHLIGKNGHNPANVTEIGTAVDIEEYTKITKRQKINAFIQFEKIFARYKDALIGYSIDDVIENQLVSQDNPKPILIGNRTETLQHFLSENVVFLQPTRIVSRKKIETGFRLVQKLFKNKDFGKRFSETSQLKLTILITGPIPMGQFDYFEKLIRRFAVLLNELKPEFKDRVYLGFLFSELDKDDFKRRFESPISIPELYNIASLVLLPSETEGRGLPIIEATATGVPILCRRYYPENVYKEVIGEHLPEEDRLKVIEFDGAKIESSHINQIIRRVFFPHKFMEEIEHNKKAVKKRYSLESLNNNIQDICKKLHYQLQPNTHLMEHAADTLIKYRKIINFTNEDLAKIINTENREYLPGYGRLSFMIYLKSLIDPSFFRVEEQEARGMAFRFANNLVNKYPGKDKIPVHKKTDFFNSVHNLFLYREGETKIRHDHSMSYRHRNKYYYPYQDLTFQELTGAINILFIDHIQPDHSREIDTSAHFFTDWNLALSQLTSSSYLAIDDRDILVRKLKSNVPVAYFPGKFVKYELEFFALQCVRARIKLDIEEELTEEVLKKHYKKIAPVYIFAQENSLGRWAAADDISNYIIKGNDAELKLLYDYQLLKIIKTKQYCAGIHFNQVGELALDILRQIREQKGFIISNRREAIVTTDIVDIDRFHIGMITYPVASNIMGIPMGSGYIQFVPAGVRTTLAYPTPIQTAVDFHMALKSKTYKELCEEHGEEFVLQKIKEDAETNGSPIKLVLDNLKNPEAGDKDAEYKYVSGVYEDGFPWNGVMAKANVSNGKAWEFEAVSSTHQTKRVTTFVEEFEKDHKQMAKIAWNGGYILNPELVGKLGLPESYIGSPLGLLISNNKVISTPLFNKPALMVMDNGKINIDLVTAKKGIEISGAEDTVVFGPDHYNNAKTESLAYYDLMYDGEEIVGDGRIIVRIAGNEIKEVLKTKAGENVKIIPVGLTLSFPADQFPKSWDKIDLELSMKINGLENVKHAVEAGPMLVSNGKNCIDMQKEGWKTDFSIRTQAARLDYLDMRGPKIAVGIDKEGNLFVLTINGRIRESVGATHIDMADIMLKFGMEKAMGFDPGGSSTLVVEGETLNISPYNSQYEKNTYALPPEPRAVANAIIGYIKE